MTNGETRAGNSSSTIPVGVGLAVGLGLILLFAIFSTSGKTPSSPISPPESGEESSEMPADFSVIYAYGIYANNILNTANNTYTHDMVVDPPVVINLTLSDLELSTIWNSTKKNNFFELKNLTDFCPESPSFDGCVQLIPEKEYRLTITANGRNHTVLLRQNYELNQAQDTALQKFKNITAIIDGLLSQKEELKQLPKPRGGYL